MARSCVFCGGTPVTREHVWPDWARRRVDDAGPREHRHIFERHGEVEEERQWDSQPFKMTVRAVCRPCNNGWMHDLEDAVERMLGPMLDGRGRILHQGGQRTLAAWVLKTALMFDQATSSNHHAFPESFYTALYQGQIPTEGLWIWIAAADDGYYGMTSVTAVETTLEGQPAPTEQNFFVRTFTIESVAFQVIATTNPGLREMEVAWPQPNIHELWPYSGSFTWAPMPCLTPTGLAWFSHRVVGELIGKAQVFEP